MRLIDLDRVFDVPILVHGNDELSRLRAIVRRIESAPTFSINVKHGHDTGKCRIFHCSICGYGFNDIFLDNEKDYPIDPNYCPNCGAYMRGDRK